MNISIVIPTFRRPLMLAELLDELTPQLAGHESVEILVIDNCADESARETVERVAQSQPAVRYIPEKQAGVVHARNRGVAEASGRYIIFIDDDEVPSPGWLKSFAGQADGTVEASFGRITPRYLEAPPAALKGLLDGLFSRERAGPTGTDIGANWISLGTGNAMFRADCFGSPEPFDVRFNKSGGEDIWLIKGLIDRGVTLRWNREALVDELVPSDRMTVAYLKARKYNQGRLRCVFMLGDSRLKLALWMLIGLVQVAGHGGSHLVLRAINSPRRSEALVRAHAGLGKLFWWRAPGSSYYSG